MNNSLVETKQRKPRESNSTKIRWKEAKTKGLVQEATCRSFSKLVLGPLDPDKPVIVDFYSDWCEPCRRLKPVFQQLAKEFGEDAATFVKVNTDKAGRLADKYNVNALPTIVVFRCGKTAATDIGFDSKKVLRKFIAKSLKEKRKKESLAVSLKRGTLDGRQKDQMKDVERAKWIYLKRLWMRFKIAEETNDKAEMKIYTAKMKRIQADLGIGDIHPSTANQLLKKHVNAMGQLT